MGYTFNAYSRNDFEDLISPETRGALTKLDNSVQGYYSEGLVTFTRMYIYQVKSITLIFVRNTNPPTLRETPLLLCGLSG